MTDTLIHEIKLIIKAWNNLDADNDIQDLILKSGANLGDEIMIAIENHETMTVLNSGKYKGSVVND